MARVMARAKMLAALAAVAIGGGAVGAQAQNVDMCADPGGFCSRSVSADCLSRFGAGSIASSSEETASTQSDSCPGQLAFYRDCVAAAAEQCGGATNRVQTPRGGCAPEDARELWRDVKESAVPEELEAFAEACQGSPQARLAATRARLLRAGEAAKSSQGGGQKKQDAAIEEAAGIEPADERGVSRAGVYQSWGAYVTDRSDDRRCWAATTPVSKRPTTAAANAAGVFLMIATFDALGSRDQASVVLGFEPAKDARLELRANGRVFELFSQDGNAWLRDEKRDDELIEAFKQGDKAEVAILWTQDPVSFEFSLAGFTNAINRVAQLCPSR